MQTTVEIIQAQGISWPMIVAGCLGLIILTAGLVVDVVLLVRILRRRITADGLLERLRSRPWNLRESGKIMLIMTVLFWFLTLSVQTGYRLYTISENQAMLIHLVMQTLVFYVGGLVLIVSAMKSRGISWRRAFLSERHQFADSVRQGVVFCLAALPPAILLGWLYTQMLVFLGFDPQPQAVITLLAEPGQPLWFQVYFILMAVVAAPVVEELLFRGVLLSAVSKHMGLALSVLSVSLLFALMHCNVKSIVPLFIMALAFSLGYVCSGRIVTAMVMHACFNLINVVGVLLVRTGLLE